MVRNLLALLLITLVAPCYAGGSKQIARVDEDGNIIFDHTVYFTVDIIEVEISEVDGAIYVSTDSHTNPLGKFDEDGYYDSGFELGAFYSTRGIDISPADRLWIAGTEKVGDFGLYEYTNDGYYINGIEDFNPNDAVFEDGLLEVWATAGNVVQEGIHKFREDGDRIFYKPGYQPYIGSSGNLLSGALWFTSIKQGKRELIKVDANGSEEFRLTNFPMPRDPQTSKLDECCWLFEHYSGDLYKVNAFGAIVFHDASFNSIAAIDVNESDGSVWVASNIPKRLVHLDKDGRRLLYMPWPGGDFAHIAVDQRNGTCIVFYEEYRSGPSPEANIEPSSLGAIKARYAGERK